jgi:hypothetical protein
MLTYFKFRHYLKTPTNRFLSIIKQVNIIIKKHRENLTAIGHHKKQGEIQLYDKINYSYFS